MKAIHHGSVALLGVITAALLLFPLESQAFQKFVLRWEGSGSRCRFIERGLQGDPNKKDTLAFRVYNEGEVDGVLHWNVKVLDRDSMKVKWVQIRNVPADTSVKLAEKSPIFRVILHGDSLKDAGPHFATLRFTTDDPTLVNGIFDVPINGHTDSFPIISATWPNEWGASWWGYDMSVIYDHIVWGESYISKFTVSNAGYAPLVVNKLMSNNGWFTLQPDSFTLPNHNSAVQITCTYKAGDTDAQATVVTSASNQWDPGELNFRITVQKAEPVFKKGKWLWGDPDTKMAKEFLIYEDSTEVVAAQLDTIFRCSDKAVAYYASGVGLSPRVARNGELYVKTKPNWNGETTLYVTATLQDSVLSDSLIVIASSTPDPPNHFDVIYPYDLSTLDLDSDSSFIWQTAVDPDAGDNVEYTLKLTIGGLDTMISGIQDTFYTTAILKQLADVEHGDTIQWTVSATDGAMDRDAWSVFTNYLPDPTSVTAEVQPRSFDLCTVYPNPFNSTVTIAVSTRFRTPVTVSVFDLTGRLVARLADQAPVEGGKSFVWSPSGIGSGEYLVQVRTADATAIRKVVMVR